ncbi:MAG: hypothetical protein KF788_08910 [Piscinibacter sp.]|nr:hypothetical protein [Piscinibacter sp.]
MAVFGSLPTDTFQSPHAGRLTVTLNAQFFANSYADAGFPSSGGGGGNLSIKGYAGPSGSPTYTPIMDKFNSGTVSFEIDYPGGDAAWPIGVVEEGFKNPGGLYTLGFQDIQLIVRLRRWASA